MSAPKVNVPKVSAGNGYTPLSIRTCETCGTPGRLCHLWDDMPVFCESCWRLAWELARDINHEASVEIDVLTLPTPTDVLRAMHAERTRHASDELPPADP